MSHVHTVAQGEHLAGIAARYGFTDFQAIWRDPANAQLKQKRKYPHTLHPGDQVVIPDRKERSESGATDKRHTYKLLGKPLRLRLAIKDFDDKPLKNEKCLLTIEGSSKEVQTDGKGMIEIVLSPEAGHGTLGVPRLDLEIPIQIGHLDPIEEESGWRGRLINLGYYDGAPEDDKPDEWRWALEEFQCDHGVRITGEADEATRNKLKSVHGC
jgi:hypothetical protein